MIIKPKKSSPPIARVKNIPIGIIARPIFPKTPAEFPKPSENITKAIVRASFPCSFLAMTVNVVDKHLFSSSICIAVKNIEKSLGTPLFIRKKSEVVPTDEGTIVLTYARKILLLQKEMERKLYRQQMAHIKRIRIGIYSILNTVIIPPLLVRFKKKHPDIEISSIHGHYQALENSLSKNNLDLIVCVQDKDNPLFDCIHLKREHFLLAIPPEHPACHKAVKMEDLTYPYLDIRELNQDCIFFQYPHQQIRWQENKLLEISGFHPKEIKEVESIQLAIQLASEKLGVAFAMESYVTSFHTQKPLAYFVTGDLKQVPWLTICTSRGLSRDPVVQDCIEIIRELINEQ